MNGPGDFADLDPDLASKLAVTAYKLAVAVAECHRLQRQAQNLASSYGDGIGDAATTVLRAINLAVR